MTPAYACWAARAPPLPSTASLRTAWTRPRASASGSSASSRTSASWRSVSAVRSWTGPFACAPGRPLATYSTTASRSSARRCARVRVCWVCSASVTSCWESFSSRVAETTAGVPAARTVRPATATPMTSLLRTRTRRPAGSGPSVAVPFFRDRFFCTGARNPVRVLVLVYSCGRGNGRSTSKRPLPPRTASDLCSVLGTEPDIAHPATRTSEHHG